MALFAFSTEPLASDVPFSMSRFGAPAETAVAGVDVRTHSGRDEPEWLAGWRTGALRAMADVDLTEPGRLDEAGHCHSIMIEVSDPADLAHLQGAWSVARWLVARGCFAVLDAHARRWWDGTTLTAWPPERPFDLGTEVSVTLESQETEGFGYVMHTCGMAKFARPDLITGVLLSAARPTHRVMRALAGRFAAGEIITPGETLPLDGGKEFSLAAYRPGDNAPEVNLNNDALLLIPAADAGR